MYPEQYQDFKICFVRQLQGRTSESIPLYQGYAITTILTVQLLLMENQQKIQIRTLDIESNLLGDSRNVKNIYVNLQRTD